jgi:peptide/nickel transport system substrate-binding protein
MYDQVVAAQAMWAAVGINTEIEVVDWATHLTRWKKGEHEILSFAMVGRMDPLARTTVLGKNNFYGYKSAEAEKLRQAMANTMDQEKQQEYFRELYKLTCRDVPLMNNFYIDSTFAFKPYVKGFNDFDMFRTRLWNMYFEK